MTRLKHWLIDRFLPAYLRDGLMEENARLTARSLQRQREIERLKAYVSGLEQSQRWARKIIIRNEVREHEHLVRRDEQQSDYRH